MSASVCGIHNHRGEAFQFRPIHLPCVLRLYLPSLACTAGALDATSASLVQPAQLPQLPCQSGVP